MVKAGAEPSGNPRNGTTRPLPAKDVASWLGISTAVANKHGAITMQASFDRGVVEGTKIIGVTTTLPESSETTPSDDVKVVAEQAP